MVSRRYVRTSVMVSRRYVRTDTAASKLVGLQLGDARLGVSWQCPFGPFCLSACSVHAFRVFLVSRLLPS